MKIFPHILVRIGGDTFEKVRHNDASRLSLARSNIKRSHDELLEQKLEVCDLLHEYIKKQSDRKIQNLLQNFRRDLYNERNIKEALINSVSEELPASLWHDVSNYIALVASHREAVGFFNAIYDEELRRTRVCFQKAIQSENFRNGLLLSSRILYDSIGSYCQKDPALFRKKEVQNEQGFLKYLSRMLTKTSPFGTFNNIALGQVGASDVPIVFDRSSGIDVISHISLNNFLYQHLVSLFITSKDIRPHLKVRLNPTIKTSQDVLVYLTNHNNIEAFQRMSRNPVLTLVIERVSSAVDGISFKSLVHLIKEDIEADLADLEKYVKQLIEFGFLEYNLGVSGVDPNWDLELKIKLQEIESEGVPCVRDFIACLDGLRSLAAEYEGANPGNRHLLLQKAYKLFKDVCLLQKPPQAADGGNLTSRTTEQKEKGSIDNMNKTNSQPKEGQVTSNSTDETQPQKPSEFRHKPMTHFNFKPEQIFYEDTVRQVNVVLDADELTEFTSRLDTLLGNLRLFNGKVEEIDKMKFFFRDNYEDNSKVDLLNFYEKYYKDVKKLEEERRQPGTIVEKAKDPKVTSEIPHVEARKKMLGSWFREYQSRISQSMDFESEAVDLLSNDLDFVNRKLGINPSHKSTPNSYGAFVQFYLGKDKKGKSTLMGVVNSNFGGFGKMISRFLQILPPTVTEDIRVWNQSLVDGNSIFIEDCDASYFNANIHPPLMPFEVRIPGGHNSLPPEKQLPISEFYVSYDIKIDKLILVHEPSGRRAFIFDLGFQSHMGRSKLFQLLEKFSKVDYLFINPVKNAFQAVWKQQGEKTGKDIMFFPRLVYEDRVVIQRKYWLVPQNKLPVRIASQTDAEYYCYLNDWRIKLGIEREVFVYVSQAGVTPNSSMAKLKPGKDDYKPQFIDFDNPLFINLFEKLLSKVNFSLRIEEMLPNSSQLQKIDNERFVTEYVIQWYNDGRE